jgi:hypothetical protein
VAICVRVEPTDKQHQIPLIKGSKNVEFHALRAIFRVASAKSTNKGHRDNRYPLFPELVTHHTPRSSIGRH